MVSDALVIVIKSGSHHFVLNCHHKHPYGFCHLMKLVPLATLVHMDIKAFSSRPSVLLLITNSIITSLAELFSTSFRSGHRAQSCSHQFVLDVASQTSVIGYVKRAHFIHDSITLTSSEFDVSSDGPLS
ncbi:hypothetical protein Tsp_15421 [Trichinella spiralis]|uniref:hypothetical protein n=1 Tax=Trichinella spiralis TaxID=6334 RepID=UPI0001EFE859|nr:hypothetical protein Tsp_15421 [Trichinella spiralis]